MYSLPVIIKPHLSNNVKIADIVCTCFLQENFIELQFNWKSLAFGSGRKWWKGGNCGRQRLLTELQVRFENREKQEASNFRSQKVVNYKKMDWVIRQEIVRLPQWLLINVTSRFKVIR